MLAGLVLCDRIGIEKHTDFCGAVTITDFRQALHLGEGVD